MTSISGKRGARFRVRSRGPHMHGQDLSGGSGPGDGSLAAPPDWDLLLRRFGRLVYSVPRRFGLRAEDCDDVFQATWLVAVSRTHPPLDGGDGVMVRWLAAIAAWETRNLMRRRKIPVRDRALLEAVESDPENLPERLQQMVEEHRVLEEALEALPPRDRDLLRDLFLSDEPLSYQEVAERLGVAVGSIGPLRLRAIEKLREELSRRGF